MTEPLSHGIAQPGCECGQAASRATGGFWLESWYNRTLAEESQFEPWTRSNRAGVPLDWAYAAGNVDMDSGSPKSSQGPQRLVLRNTLNLVLAQVLGMPLSVLVNAMMARHLGPEEFGQSYLAATYSSFGFLLVDWGQGSTLPALVAKDRTRAGEMLGSGLAFRVVMSVFVFALLQLCSWLLGYGLSFQVVLALVMVGAIIGTVTRALQDAVRGLERTDLAALGQIGAQVLGAALVVPTLLLGGRLKAVLIANIVSAVVILLLVWWAVRKIDLGRLRANLPAARELLRHGSPFLVLALIMELQPSIDALFLSKLAPGQVVGWHAAARRLVGILIFPAGALIAALYPTLCRLHQDDMDGFRRAARGALRASAALVMPVAIGCALYPDIGTRIFSRSSFGEAENNLRVLSPFVFLLYFSMTLGTCVTAAGLQRKWAVAQFLCVGVSVIADPILVPYFQARTGNGGLGVCIATGISELLMVASGVYLTPRGIFDRSLLQSLVKVFVAGVAMVGVGRALSDFHSFIGASVALVTYFAAALALGGIEKSDLAMLRGMLTRKRGAR